MNVTWLLSGNDVVNNQVLLSEIDFYGDAKFIIKPFGELPKVDGPVVSMVPLDMCVRINKTTAYPGAYCNLVNLKCSMYYQHYTKYLLNSHCFMLPVCMLENAVDDIFHWWLDETYEDVFIRPDSGFKSFTGQLVSRKNFSTDIKQLCHVAQNETELCVIAAPVNLLREWRFVIGQKKIISCSQYRDHIKTPSGIPEPVRELKPGAPKNVVEFVEKVLSEVDWQPDLVYTMDIGETTFYGDNQFKIVEINCFSAAGLYRCDMSKVVREVRQIVIEDFMEYHREQQLYNS